VGGTLHKAALLLCFFFALVACSKEPPGEPNRAETRNAPRGTLAEGADDPGVSVEAPRQPAIEGARLQTGVEGEEIIVVVGVGHEGFFPTCFLMEARPPARPGREGVFGRRAESSWPKVGATETVQMGGSYVVVFHEDPHPGAKVADPRKTPYSVLCMEAITMRTVGAHVEGTPKASPYLTRPFAGLVGKTSSPRPARRGSVRPPRPLARPPGPQEAIPP
jgi:hypothetical protein